MFQFKSLCLLLVGVAVCTALSPSALGGFRHGGSSRSSGSSHTSYGGGSHSSGGHSYSSGEDAHAAIEAFKSDVRHDGFDFALKTSNHIEERRAGDAYGNVHGDFGWLSKDGVPVHVSYVADENGYQPSSDLLPTPPPIPKEIVKLLEYIRTHPQKEENQHYGQAHHHSSHRG